MSDLISREEAIDAFEDTTFTKNEILRRLLELSPVEAEPRKRGQWVNIREMGEGQWYGECNRCWHLRHIDEYCSNCGAKMDEVVQ